MTWRWTLAQDGMRPSAATGPGCIECAEKPPIGLDRAYSAKPLVLVEKQLTFPEIAILSFFKKMGWEGAWVDSQHRKFFDRMPNQSKGMSLDSHAAQVISRIAQYNDNSRAGCWDLVLWVERAVAFAAVIAAAQGAAADGAPPGRAAGQGRADRRWRGQDTVDFRRREIGAFAQPVRGCGVGLPKSRCEEEEKWLSIVLMPLKTFPLSESCSRSTGAR